MFRGCVLLLVSATCVFAAERRFDFAESADGTVPSSFRAMMTGEGNPGEWKIVPDEVPSVLAPFSARSPEATKRAVLAQVSQDRTSSRAPMLVFEPESYSDFTFRTRIKILSGSVEQMAGVAFRLQDERNYYYIRLNAINRNVAFFRYVEGELIGPVSREANLRTNEWYELAIECRGSKFRALLEEKEILPWTEPSYVPFPDGTSKGVFGSGKIAFWTKADTVAHFADARIDYVPREPFAQALVRETLQNHPRLLGLQIYGIKDGAPAPTVLASDEEQKIGEKGGEVELNCITLGGNYFGRGKQLVVVTMPLHDRNGERVAAVRVEMTTFFGQTEKNALARALPIVKSMESRIRSAVELLQ